MRKLILFGIFFTGHLVLFAQEAELCPFYKKYITIGNTEIQKGHNANFEKAINAYSTAMLHCPERAEEARDRIVVAYQKIERLKAIAEAERDNAEQAKREAIQAKEDAERQRDIAQRAQKTANEAKDAAERRRKEALAAKKSADESAIIAEEEKQKAKQKARALLANDIADKAKNLLNKGNRTTAFQLVAFAHNYLDKTNDEVGKIIHEAYYYNQHHERQTKAHNRKSWNYNFLMHGTPIHAVNFSEDGNYVVSASSDQTAKLWQLNTGQELMTFVGHSDVVRSANFSPDGSRIVTASRDHTAKLWNAQNGKEIQTFVGHKSYLNTANFSPNGRHIVTTSRDKTIKLWEVETGKEIHTFLGHTSAVTSADFSPDGKYVVSSSEDKTARVWEANTGKLIKI